MKDSRDLSFKPREEFADLDKGKPQSYRRPNLRLSIVTTVIGSVVAYVTMSFSPQLNTIVVFGFPLRYLLGAQGSLIIFMILIFNFALGTNRSDVDFSLDGETE